MRLRYQFELIQIIRNYFLQQGFLDVLTPPAVENPGMEVHIHPFALNSVREKRQLPLYLHTSPEFCMKDLLCSPEEELSEIFTISYCFRDEPDSPIHRKQFLMLEWYRKNCRYEKIMEDTEGLLEYVIKESVKNKLPVREGLRGQTLVKKTMQQLFQEELGIDILDYLDVPSIQALLKNFPEVPVPTTELLWDDYFFLLYLNKIEPSLPKYPLLLIYEFPAPLSALSTIKAANPKVCERFEVYVNGVELCNCFNELTNVAEQKKRFADQHRLKKELYGYELPTPAAFYLALERGLPPSAGIALGVERLLYSVLKIDNPFYL
ncbi:MAG TPA: amino acid--tRNA ligase-related protein [Bacteriovoracaceae bacterium]|nr:amino acid--tRNA ligase-related protein [Bacteriovoracaceae bacterium]